MTTNDTAQAVCDRTGLAVIEVHFFNNSPKNVAVAAKDSQSLNSVELHSIKPHQLASGEIITGKQILSDGQVVFTVSPINGDQTDSSRAQYTGVSCNSAIVPPTNNPAPTILSISQAPTTLVTIAPAATASHLPSTGGGINSLLLLITLISAGSILLKYRGNRFKN